MDWLTSTLAGAGNALMAIEGPVAMLSRQELVPGHAFSARMGLAVRAASAHTAAVGEIATVGGGPGWSTTSSTPPSRKASVTAVIKSAARGWSRTAARRAARRG